MRNLILLLCIPIVACCADRRDGATASATARSTDAEASTNSVIFPLERGEQVRWLGYIDTVSFWTPTRADVAPLETRMRELLEQAAADPTQVDEHSIGKPESQAWIRTEIEQIIERVGDYRLQFVGVIDADRTHRILVRAFAGPAFEGGIAFENWREQLAIVSDGGFWYWYAVYDPATARFVHLRSNGYA